MVCDDMLSQTRRGRNQHLHFFLNVVEVSPIATVILNEGSCWSIAFSACSPEGGSPGSLLSLSESIMSSQTTLGSHC